jgi:hypothetical protein
MANSGGNPSVLPYSRDKLSAAWKEGPMTTNRADAGPLPGRPPEPSLEEILRVKHPEGTFTVADMLNSSSGFESDDEIDEFVAAVREWRNESLA